jgi:hypothetical protein
MSDLPELKEALPKRLLGPLRVVEEKVRLSAEHQKKINLQIAERLNQKASELEMVVSHVKQIQDDRGVDADRRKKQLDEQEAMNRMLVQDIQDASDALKLVLKDHSYILEDLEGRSGRLDCAVANIQDQHEEFKEELDKHERAALDAEQEGWNVEEKRDKLQEKNEDDHRKLMARVDDLEKYFQDSKSDLLMKIQELAASDKATGLLVKEHFSVYQQRADESHEKREKELKDLLLQIQENLNKISAEQHRLEDKVNQLSKTSDSPDQVKDFVKQVGYNTKQLARLASQLEGKDGK